MKFEFEYASTCEVDFEDKVEFFKWKDIEAKDLEEEWLTFVNTIGEVLTKDGWVLSGSGYWHMHYIRGGEMTSLGEYRHCTSNNCFLTMNVKA